MLKASVARPETDETILIREIRYTGKIKLLTEAERNNKAAISYPPDIPTFHVVEIVIPSFYGGSSTIYASHIVTDNGWKIP